MPPRRRSLDLPASESERCYRHFPRRSDLFKASSTGVDACADAATTLSAAHEPGEALARWLQRYTEFLAIKPGLATALHSGDPAFDALPTTSCSDFEPPSARCSRRDSERRDAWRHQPERSPLRRRQPVLPWRTKGSHTANAWSRYLSTDCATGPSRARPAPEAKDPNRVVPSPIAGAPVRPRTRWSPTARSAVPACRWRAVASVCDDRVPALDDKNYFRERAVARLHLHAKRERRQRLSRVSNVVHCGREMAIRGTIAGDHGTRPHSRSVASLSIPILGDAGGMSRCSSAELGGLGQNRRSGADRPGCARTQSLRL